MTPCPKCAARLSHVRDLMGGALEVCRCGFAQPLVRRPPPPVEVIPPSPQHAARPSRYEYHKAYRAKHREKMTTNLKAWRERQKRRRAA